jgi:hypothetical protein
MPCGIFRVLNTDSIKSFDAFSESLLELATMAYLAKQAFEQGYHLQKAPFFFFQEFSFPLS